MENIIFYNRGNKQYQIRKRNNSKIARFYIINNEKSIFQYCKKVKDIKFIEFNLFSKFIKNAPKIVKMCVKI